MNDIQHADDAVVIIGSGAGGGTGLRSGRIDRRTPPTALPRHTQHGHFSHERTAGSRRNLNLSHPTACSTQKKEFYHDRQCDHLAL